MFVTSRKYGVWAVALLGAALLLGGCGKSSGGSAEVQDASNGSTVADNGATDSEPEVKVEEKSGDVHVKAPGVEVRVDGDKVTPPKKAPKPVTDFCSNIKDTQAKVPDGYVPTWDGNAEGHLKCVKLADLMNGRRAPASPDQLEKQIIDEVNKSLRDAGIKVTVK